MLCPADLIGEHLELPSVPAVVVRLNELLTGRIPSMGEVSDLISSDPSLAASVLRLVNSPLYPYRNRIDSLQRAATLLGVRELRNLALAASVSRLGDALSSELLGMEQFWRHSLYVGLISRGLAEAASQRELDRYFVMGLLHDLGLLVLLSQKPVQAGEAIARSKAERVLLADAERAVLGYTHAEVGTELMRRWRLPENIVAAVGGHHDRAIDGEHKLAIGIVHLADLIASNLPEATLGLGHIEGAVISDWERINVHHGVRDPIVAEAGNRFESTRQALFG